MTDSRACLRYLVLGCALGAWVCGGACSESSTPDAGMPADAGPPVGGVSLAWEITDGTDPLSCSEINAYVVRVQALPTGGGSAIIETLACEAGVGSVQLPEGVYDLEIGLVANVMDALGELFTQNAVTVREGETMSLGTVTFEVSPEGNVELFLDAPVAGNNCDPEPEGAGITEIQLELRDRDGTCVPATFDIEAGATQPAGTYETDCAGARFGCIENDQRVRVEGVRAGRHTLVITGFQGDLGCFQRNSQFDVPGGDLTATLDTLQLMPNDSVPECVPEGAGPDAGVGNAAP